MQPRCICCRCPFRHNARTSTNSSPHTITVVHCRRRRRRVTERLDTNSKRVRQTQKRGETGLTNSAVQRLCSTLLFPATRGHSLIPLLLPLPIVIVVIIPLHRTSRTPNKHAQPHNIYYARTHHQNNQLKQPIIHRLNDVHRTNDKSRMTNIDAQHHALKRVGSATSCDAISCRASTRVHKSHDSCAM
jgi:hypothetical protein